MQFKVFGVSENRNSFGLHGVRLLNRQGHFYEVGISLYHLPKRGDVVHVPFNNGHLDFAAAQCEIVERHYPDAPQEVIDTVWGESFAEQEALYDLRCTKCRSNIERGEGACVDGDVVLCPECAVNADAV